MPKVEVLDVYEYLLRKALENGVPTAVCAKIFDLAEEPIIEMKREVMVQEFGTDDRAEYMDHLQWLSLQAAGDVLVSGDSAERTRVITAVFGRQIQAAGKRASPKDSQDRDALLSSLDKMRTGTPQKEAPSKFVVGAQPDA